MSDVGGKYIGSRPQGKLEADGKAFEGGGTVVRQNTAGVVRDFLSPVCPMVLYLWAGVLKSVVPDILSRVDLTLGLGICTALATLTTILRGGRLRIPRVFLPLYGTFVMSLVVGSLVSTADPSSVSLKLGRIVLVDGLAVCSAMILIQRERDLECFIRLHIAIATIASIAVISQAVPGRLSFTTVGQSSYITNGRLLSTGLCLLLGRQGSSRVSVWFRAASLLVGLLLTAARGPLLATCVTLSVVLGIGFVSRAKRVKLGRLKTIVSVVCVAAVLGVLLNQGYFVTAQRRLESLWNWRDDASTSVRMNLGRVAWSMFLSRPVFGWGLASFAQVAETASVEETPHNLILELLAELGLIGCLSFVCWVFAAVFAVGRRFRPEYTIGSTWLAMASALLFWIASIPMLALTSSRVFVVLLTIALRTRGFQWTGGNQVRSG